MRELVGNGKTLFLNFMFDLAAQEMKNIEVMKSVTTFLSFVRSRENQTIQVAKGRCPGHVVVGGDS